MPLSSGSGKHLVGYTVDGAPFYEEPHTLTSGGILLRHLLAVLFPRKEKKLRLTGHDLHEHLIKNLISEVGFAMIIPLSTATAGYFTNLERLEPYLKIGYRKLQQQNATSIATHLDFGELLHTAYELMN